MFNWRKKQSSNESKSSTLPWDNTATQALEQALQQTTVPKIMKGQVKKQLIQAAEDQARQSNRTSVTSEDLMKGMLALMPASVRDKIEQAAKEGPQALTKLAQDAANKN